MRPKGAPFYNNELKERFIDSRKESMRANCRTVFRATLPVEEMLGKDVHSFNKEEIDILYSYLNKGTVNGIAMINNTIRTYMRWAYTNGIVTDYDHYIDGLTQSNLSRFCNQVAKRNCIIDRETIINWTKQLRNDFDFYNPRDSFLLLAPFEGINGYMMSDVVEIQWSHFKKMNGKYYAFVRNRTIEVSKELYDIAKEARFEDKYCSGINKYNKLSYFTLENSDRIVRLVQSKNSKNFTYQAIRKQLRKVLVMLGAEYLTLKDLDISGKVYMAEQKAAEHNMTMINYLWSHYFLDEVCQQFDMSTRDDESIHNQIKAIKRAMEI